MAKILRRWFPLTLVCIFLASQHSLSQITSTTAGGNWEASSTWGGGVVPGASNDVVIAGPVGYATGTGSGYVCRNLTVNSGGSLFNRTGYAWPDQILNVNGNVINNGTIRNESSNGLVLKVQGNITNNGTWTLRRTELTGTATQTLALASGKMFESPFKVTGSAGLVAGSDLKTSSSVDLNKVTLNMANFAITFVSNSAGVTNGSVSNAKDIVGVPVSGTYYPIFDNITYDGSPNIKGRVQINSLVTLKGTVTITDTLENSSGYGHPEKKLQITGNLTNNGIIRNWFSYGIALAVTGNITNNGTWAHNRTELSGNSDQVLALATGKQFESSFSVTDSVLGMVVAGSNLSFTREFNLGKTILDMKNFAVTLTGSGTNISNGRVINTKDLVGKPAAGATYPYLNNITYEGNPNIKGRLEIHTLVVMKGDVTVTDTLENLSGYGHPEKILNIVGNITNNGIIRNYYSYGLALNVTGNVTNNGTWVHNRTELSGTSNQILTLSANKLFEAAFKVTDSLGMIVAGSNLATTSWFELRKCVLDMKNYTLTLQGGGATVYNGIVMNTKDLVGKMIGDIYGTPILDNVTYNGTINLRGFLRVNAATLQGNVTITDTVQNSSGYGHPEKFLKIIGNLTNNGLVRNGGSYGLSIEVTGNVTATKAFTNNRIFLSGNGNRTIVDKISQVTYLSTGEKVGLWGDNYLPNLSIDAKSKCQLASGGNLYVPNSAIDERLDNWSVITYTRKLSSSQTNTFFKARVTVIPNSGIDSLKVSSYGHQVPARFANAVRTWYRLDRTPKTATSSVSSLTMYYSDEELGQNIEANLQVYYSADSGRSWRQLSTTLNLTRNVAQNYVTIADVPSIGDYLLSSSPDPVSVRPSVIVSLMGRTQIRVGPPNQYTVQYVNNSDVETGDMILELRGTGGVHLKSVTPSPQPGYKSTTLPIDSLTYDGDDTSVLLWVTSMAPREERTFSLVATATPGLGKTSSTAELITLTTVVVYVGVGLIVDWVTDAAVNGTEAAYATKVSKGDMTKATKQALNETYQKQKIGREWREEPVKKVTGEVAEKLTEKFFGVVLWPLKLGKVLLVDCVGGAIRGAKRYVGGDATEQAEVFMEEGAKPLQKVTSWDPNEKIAPDGYGTQRFLSTIGRMNYQILFENKKEATAPAYTIVVVDTLQADFDSTSVVFEKTSHDGPAYNWQMSRNGNILKWRIDAIELPPNVNPPEGEGYVTFSVKPKSGTASGTVLKNTATITFDINAPIRTNQVLNTLDFTPPTTVMKPIPAKLTSGTIVVKWQATDGTGGSGVASTTVFASKDGGPYISVGTSSSDSLVFTPSGGSHKYTFYALAKDNVGNVESVRPAIVTTDIVNDVEEKIPVPTEFSLSQNYPNPFNPTTQIVFSLSATVRATLKVYDMLGREIVTLVDEERNPGRYTVQWDASKVASGVYFYRLIVGDFVQTRKLVLIK